METRTTILIVDEPSGWRRALGDALSELAYEVRYADAPEMARAILGDPGESIDLLLLAEQPPRLLAALDACDRHGDPADGMKILLIAGEPGQVPSERLRAQGVLGAIHRGDPLSETLDVIAGLLYGTGPAVRYFANLPTTRVRAGDREVVVTMIDISGGGAQIGLAGAAPRELFSRPLAIGEMVEVGLSLSFGSADGTMEEEHSGARGDGLHIRAQIRNLRQLDGRLLVGVRFVSMSEDAWLALAAILRHHHRLGDGPFLQARVHAVRRAERSP